VRDDEWPGIPRSGDEIAELDPSNEGIVPRTRDPPLLESALDAPLDDGDADCTKGLGDCGRAQLVRLPDHRFPLR
jgi:hypothetical protein